MNEYAVNVYKVLIEEGYDIKLYEYEGEGNMLWIDFETNLATMILDRETFKFINDNLLKK